MTTSVTPIFDGRIFTVERHEVRLPDGGESIRDIIRHPGAVGVVARKPNGRFVFVRQYRKAIEAVTLECVAGTLDPDESPEICARRELEEETGYRAANLEHIGRVHPSPGYIEERIELYFAEIDPEPGTPHSDEDENVEPVELTADEITTAICNGEITDSKTVAAWLLYEKKIDTRIADKTEG